MLVYVALIVPLEICKALKGVLMYDIKKILRLSRLRIKLQDGEKQ